MIYATVRFHGELNDFLPRARRNVEIAYQSDGKVSIKDVVESLGVPHTEIEALVVGGQSVDLQFVLTQDTQAEAYPLAMAASIPHVALRPPIPMPRRFVLDTHLGTLASYLRMFGFDTLYRNDYDDDELAQVADEETRILLTRDRGLLKRGRVLFGYFVRETNPQRQIAEIVGRYGLRTSIETLRRCIRCNGLLRPVSKESILDRLAPKTAAYYSEFSLCDSCDQIYWRGSHYEHMRNFIDSLLRDEA